MTVKAVFAAPLVLIAGGLAYSAVLGLMQR